MPHSPAKSIFRLHVISSVHTHTYPRETHSIFCGVDSVGQGLLCHSFHFHPSVIRFFLHANLPSSSYINQNGGLMCIDPWWLLMVVTWIKILPCEPLKEVVSFVFISCYHQSGTSNKGKLHTLDANTGRRLPDTPE